MKIDIRKDARLPKARQRKYTREEALEVKKQLDELLKAGKIRESRSTSAVGTLFVPKADGAWTCDQLMQLRSQTRTNHHSRKQQEKEFKVLDISLDSTCGTVITT